MKRREEDTAVIRWTISTGSRKRLADLSQKRGVRIWEYIEHLIDREYAIYHGEPHPVAPWNRKSSEQDYEMKKYGENYRALLGKDGKKSSLAWLMADDKGFIHEINGHEVITPKEIETLVMKLQFERFSDFKSPKTDATVDQLIAILRARKIIFREKRGVYKVITHQSIDDDTVEIDGERISVRSVWGNLEE